MTAELVPLTLAEEALLRRRAAVLRPGDPDAFGNLTVQRLLATLDRERAGVAASDGLREALRRAVKQWEMYANEQRGPGHDLDYIAASDDPEDAEAALFREARAALAAATTPEEER